MKMEEWWLIMGLVVVAMVSGISVWSAEKLSEAKSALGGGLVGYWNFDEGQETVVKDSSGNNNDGEVVDATWTKGKIGGALSFDGEDNYVKVEADDSLLPKDNQVSIECWINLSDVTGKLQHPVAKWHNYHLRLSSNLDYLVFTVFDEDEEEKEVYTLANYTFDLGTWYHIAGVYDGHTSYIYINGELKISKPIDIKIDTRNTHNLHLGSVSWGVAEFFNGLLDEVRIYNRALSAGEIKTHYEGKVMPEKKPEVKVPKVKAPEAKAPEAKAAENLVLNPGFEEGNEKPDGWEVGIPDYFKDKTPDLIWDDEAHSGKKSYKYLGKTEGDGGFCYSAEPIEVDAKKEYVIGGWLKYKNTSLAWIHIWPFDNEGKVLEEPVHIRESGTRDWHLFLRSFRLPPRTVTVRICLESHESGEVWFDDVFFREASKSDGGLKAVISTKDLCSAGEKVILDGTGSLFSKEFPIGNYQWKIRGKSQEITKEGPKISHCFFAPGEYSVQLTIISTTGATSKDRISITVETNVLPVACAGGDREAQTGEKISFDTTRSFDPDGKITKYQWDFGDGTTAEGEKVNHTYKFNPEENLSAKKIAYTVTLRVTDNKDLSSEDKIRVTVTNGKVYKKIKASLTLKEQITVKVEYGKILVEQAPKAINLRFGFIEYLPISVLNSTPETVELQVSARLPKNVYFEEMKFNLSPLQEIKDCLPFQSLRAWDHSLQLIFTCGSKEVSLPLNVNVEMKYPVFGTIEHFSRTPPGKIKAEEDIKYLEDLPCQVFRLDCVGNWSIEKVKGKFDWSWIDWYVPKLKEMGSRMVMLCGYPCPWLPFNPHNYTQKELEEYVSAYKDYVRALVRRYGADIDYWEPWNEPEGFWFNNKVGEPEIKAMFAITKAMWEVIREEDPTAKVLTPGFTPGPLCIGTPGYNLLDGMFKMGVADYVDAICIHNYAVSSPPCFEYKMVKGKRVADTYNLTDWLKGVDRKADIGQLLDSMEKYGVNKPVWFTEFSGTYEENEREWAIGILRQIAINVSQGVQGMVQYEFYDYPHDAHPPIFKLMRRADHYKFSGFYAYGKIIQALTGAIPDSAMEEMIKSLKANELNYRVFQRGLESILCLWSNAISKKQVVFKINTELLDVLDISFSPDPDRGFIQERKLSAFESQSGMLDIILEPAEFRILCFRLNKKQPKWIEVKL